MVYSISIFLNVLWSTCFMHKSLKLLNLKMLNNVVILSCYLVFKFLLLEKHIFIKFRLYNFHGKYVFECLIYFHYYKIHLFIIL